MTLLELVKAACREMALPLPNAVATATDQQTVQMFGLMNAVGTELLDYQDFQVIQEETTLVTTGTGTASLPSDYHRMLNMTQWDRTNRWQLAGPVPPEGWQWLKSSQLASVGPIQRFRVRGNAIEYYPATDTGNTYAYEYIRKTWVIDGDGTTEKALFDADDDTCVYRDRLMIAGLKWKFYEAKGFDASAYLRDFMTQVEAQAADAGAPALSLSGGRGQHLLNNSNIPDSGYGS